MLNKEKHQLIMGRILKDIYTDTSISPILGFKGGTCAYLFYSLPRFSVDLDFDLLSTDDSTPKQVFEKIKNILKKYGEIKESHIKHYTLFALLSYGDTDHNIKIEIRTKDLIPHIKNHYELKEYLGIPLFAGKKEYLFSGKLAALTLRSTIAMRDVYDIWFFAQNNWDIDPEVIKTRTNKSIEKHLADCISVIKQIKDNQILQGLGELLSEKEKIWVKNNLRQETIFMLKNYISSLSTKSLLK